MNKYILPVLLVFIFCFLSVNLQAHDMNADSGLSGTALDREGKPLHDAVVVFFNTQGPPPDPARHWRIPDGGRMIFEGGRFLVGLPEGRYYFGIIKDPPPGKEGQPGFEDWLYFSRDEQGKPISYQVKAGEVNDLGTITVGGPLIENPNDAGIESTAIQGLLTLKGGQPLANFIVEAYSTGEGKGRHLFSSEKTTAKGEYRILVAPGSYRLKIRPLPDANRMNVTEKDQVLPSTVTVQQEEQQRIDLHVVRQ